MKRKTRQLRQMAKAIRASAPRLPRMKTPKPKGEALKPRKARRQPVVIGPKELEEAREGLAFIARGGMTDAFAVNCFANALLEESGERSDKDRMRLLKVAGAATEDRLLRTLCLMLQVRLLRQEFPAHHNDSKRLRYVVSQALSLLKEATASASWTNDKTLADWVEITRKDVQARADELPDAEPVDGEDTEDIDPDADASPSVVTFEGE